MENPAPHRVDELAAAQKPILKILQHQGARMAIRLEAIFWSQLADIARERKTKPSRLVFEVLAGIPAGANRTSRLRCLCLDSLRRKQQPMQALANQSYDMMGMIAACPTPVAVITFERKLVAINPALSEIVAEIRQSTDDQRRALQLSFSEPMARIVTAIIEKPQNIRTYHVGLQVGNAPARQFSARFALADRSKGTESLIFVYLKP